MQNDMTADALEFSANFQREIRERFGLTETFVRRLMQGKRTVGRAIDRWEDLVNPGQNLSSAYIHFALSNVVRGRQARDLIMRKTGVKGGRSLDVGSAYGGMVAAFAEEGFEAEGVEIDPHWRELGNLNCRSKGLGELIRLGDFLAEPDQPPTYDVITCNDVIEHVHEPRRAIAKMASMLKPGGVLYLVIPNAWSWDHVVRDGHYGQFGLNLLDHYAAKAYYDLRCRAVYQKAYSCGEFYPLDWYRAQLASSGLSTTVHRATAAKIPAQAEFDGILQKLDDAFSNWNREGLPEVLHDRVVIRFDAYREDLVRRYRLATSAAVEDAPPQDQGVHLKTYIENLAGRRRLPSNSTIEKAPARGTPADAEDCNWFCEDFLDSFWTVIATRPA